MHLIWNWQKVVKRAWSMRLMLLAAVFSGLEVALPLLDGVLPVDKGVFAALCGGTVIVAMIARVLYQPEVRL